MNHSEIEQTLRNWKARTPSGRIHSAIFAPRNRAGDQRPPAGERLAACFSLPDRRLWATLSGAAAATACLAVLTFLQMELPGGRMGIGGTGTNGLLGSNLLAETWLHGSRTGFDSQQVNVWSQATLASTNRNPGH